MKILLNLKIIIIKQMKFDNTINEFEIDDNINFENKNNMNENDNKKMKEKK